MTRTILQSLTTRSGNAKRLLREQLRCVLGMLSSLGVQVPRPT